jgi:predicted N-acyltransferase
MDGIYSMYGDVAPAKEVIEMLDRNRQMHLYVDDAHGMSWMGKHGAGYFMSQVKEHHPKMILSTSLAKSFGSAGGVFVFPNEELCWKVRTWGGPLTYSGPQQPATIGCSIASAKIHLSDEITVKQQELLKKIKLCNEVLKHRQVPLVSETDVPIRFVGVGLPKVGYNLVYKLIKEGYYTNLGVYPAVPETCTGIRFTITNQLTEDDVVGLGESIAKNLPLALKEENRSMDDIYRAFKMLRTKKAADEIKPSPVSVSKFSVERKTSVGEIDEQEWNSVLGENGVYDWKGLRLLERIFSNNEKPEHNWKFIYYQVRNEKGVLVAATFFTLALSKDDMLSPAEVSEKIEEQRKDDPYYLTSSCYMMGSLISEGQHLWIDRNAPDWKEFTMLLVDEIWRDYETLQADALYLRDFAAEDLELRNYFIDRGFLKAEMPNRNLIEELNWETGEEFLMQLPQKKRNRIRREVIRYEDYFETRFVKNASEEEINYWYSLYLNIHNKNLRINSFALPKKMFSEMTKEEQVDVIELWLKPEFDKREERKPVAVGFIYKTSEGYFPWVLGMDYEFREFHVYRQLIYKAILRAKQLGRKKISLGFTADEEKGKFGAVSIPTVSYIQVRDNFNLSVIGIIKR